MKVMFDSINIIGIIFEVIIMNSFFSMVSKKKTLPSHTVLLVSVSMVIIQTLILVLIKIPLLTIIMTFITILVISFLYEMNILGRVLLSICVMGMFMISEMVTGLLLSMVYKMPVEILNNNIIFYLQGILLSKLFMISIMKILGYFMSPINIRPSGALFISLIIQPIATCFIIYITSTYLVQEESKTKVIMSTIVSLMLIVSNIVMFYLLEYQMKENERKKNNELYEQELSYKVQYYKDLATRQKISNKSMHDLKNQLFAIKEALKKDNSEGLKKINDICESVFNDRPEIYTGNESLDALISAKAQQMKLLGIALKNVVFISGIGIINIYDLCIVCGNLLDNAIEACSKMEAENKRIIFEMKQKDSYLCIQISNTTQNVVKIVNNEIQTTKKDKDMHGFGLKSVQEIVHKYNGTVTYKQSEGFFSVIVSMKNM